MSFTVNYQLRRVAPLSDVERATLLAQVASYSDGWESGEFDVEVGEDDDEPIARGFAELPDDADHPDVIRFLNALAALAAAIEDAECVFDQGGDRIGWDARKGAFVFRKPRRRRAEAPVVEPIAPPTPTIAPLTELPRPRYTREGLRRWLDAVPASLPLPPGPPASWTSAFNLFGPVPVLARGDRGQDRALDGELLRIVLSELGRPTDPSEQEALLLATPIPGEAAASVLLRLLRDPRYHVRQKAALCLGHVGDASAVPALARRLDDYDNDARRAAAEALGRIGDRSAAPDLARRAWDADTSVSAARLEAIERLGAWDEVSGLLDRTSGDDAATLANAICEAIEEGEAAELAEFLTHGDRDLQRAAARVLASRPALAASAVDALVGRLRESGDEEVGVLCAKACGAAGEEALEPLVELLEDDGWEVRTFAAIAFSSNPSLAMLAIEELRARLEDGDDDVRREAALALLVCGSSDLRAEEAVSGLASQRYGFLERAAAYASKVPALSTAGILLGRVPPSLELVPLLADTRVDGAVRGMGALLLALAEPDLSWTLLERLARDDARVSPMDLRRYAAAALLLTGYPPVGNGSVHRILLCHSGEVQTRSVGRVDELVGRQGDLACLASKDGDWPIRLDALRLLQQLGPEAVAPYKSLIAYTARHDPDADVRNQAGSMLAAQWREASPADRLADALIAPHGSGDDTARVTAFRALADAEPVLAHRLARHFFRSDERTLARAAGEVLGRTATDADVGQLVGLAVARLEDSNWIAREAACDLLGSIPVDALPEGMLDEIAEALKVRVDEDADSDVRTAANAALARLGRAAPTSEEED